MPDSADARRPGLVARAQRLLRELGRAGPLFVLAMLGPLVGALVVGATSNHWLPWFGDDAWSVVAFWLVGALLAAGCLLPTHATSLIAGYLFGAALGALVGWLVVLLAAVIGFWLWVRLIGARVLDTMAGSPNAVRVHRALLGRGFWRTTWLIALLRLSPATPFAATNLLMAAFGVRASAFLSATVLGIAPRCVAVAIVGAELSELDWRAGGNQWSTAIAIVATVVAVFVIGRIARAALRRETAVGAAVADERMDV